MFFPVQSRLDKFTCIFITKHTLFVDLRDSMAQTDLLLLLQLDKGIERKTSVIATTVTHEKSAETGNTSGDISPELRPSSQEKSCPSSGKGPIHTERKRS